MIKTKQYDLKIIIKIFEKSPSYVIVLNAIIMLVEI